MKTKGQLRKENPLGGEVAWIHGCSSAKLLIACHSSLENSVRFSLELYLCEKDLHRTMLENEDWEKLFSQRAMIVSQLKQKTNASPAYLEETFDKVVLVMLERYARVSFDSYEHFKNYIKRAIFNNVCSDFKKRVRRASTPFLQEYPHASSTPSALEHMEESKSASSVLRQMEELLVTIENGKIRHRCAIILACIAQDPERFVKIRKGLCVFDVIELSKRIRKPKMSQRTIRRYIQRVQLLL